MRSFLLPKTSTADALGLGEQLHATRTFLLPGAALGPPSNVAVLVDLLVQLYREEGRLDCGGRPVAAAAFTPVVVKGLVTDWDTLEAPPYALNSAVFFCTGEKNFGSEDACPLLLW